VIPGTWLKWNVTESGRSPIWFRLVSEDQYGTVNDPGPVVYRLDFGSTRQPAIIVNEKFIKALTPAQKGDHPTLPAQKIIKPILPDAQPTPPKSAETPRYLEWVRAARAERDLQWAEHLRRAAIAGKV
jgi:hypothetical protein